VRVCVRGCGQRRQIFIKATTKTDGVWSGAILAKALRNGEPLLLAGERALERAQDILPRVL